MKKIVLKKKLLVLTSLAILLSAASWLVYTKVLDQSLCLAASQENTAAVARLLKRGANPNAVGVVPAPDCDCDTDPLHALSLAVTNPPASCWEQMGPVPISYKEAGMGTAALLLRAGADVNARDKDGSTALMLARTPRMVKFLLAHGAKVDLRNKNGETALLQDAGSDRGILNALVSGSADVNARDKRGRTVLMIAVSSSSDDAADRKSTAGLAKALTAAGANVNFRDDQGKTALGYALDSKQTDSVRFLKHIGARL